MKDKALNMSANELVRDELECEDCMAELGGNKEPCLFSTAAADGQDDEVKDGPPAWCSPTIVCTWEAGSDPGESNGTASRKFR